MRNTKSILIVFLWIFLIVPSFTAQVEKATPQRLRTIEIEDILTWENIQTTVLSNIGQWFAYRLSPNRGDSEIVIRETEGEKEFRFPIGEAHGLRKSPSQIDYTLRMREFFDHYLKGKPAPKWLQEGIPYLNMKEHIKGQAKKAIKLKRPPEKMTEMISQGYLIQKANSSHTQYQLAKGRVLFGEGEARSLRTKVNSYIGKEAG